MMDESILDFVSLKSVYFMKIEKACNVHLKSWALSYEIGVWISCRTGDSLSDTVWIYWI
jgi:hypothetical protein